MVSLGYMECYSELKLEVVLGKLGLGGLNWREVALLRGGIILIPTALLFLTLLVVHSNSTEFDLLLLSSAKYSSLI